MKASNPILALACVLLSGTAAHAACAPPMPGVGRIEGVVRAAEDGSTVCIQTGAGHLNLTRLRLMDVTAPPLTAPGGEGAKWALRRAARGKAVVCEVVHDGVGLCRSGSTPLGELVRGRR